MITIHRIISPKNLDVYLNAIKDGDLELAQKMELLSPSDEAIIIQFNMDILSKKLSLLGFRSIGLIQPIVI